MSDLDYFKRVFFEECHELLNVTETKLMEIASGTYEAEDIHAIFRAVHSIKGGSGSFSFDNLVNFAHNFETVLDLVRNNEIELTTELTEILLRANDVLTDLVIQAEAESGSVPAQMQDVLLQLESVMLGDTQSYRVPEKHENPSAATESQKQDIPSLYEYDITFKPFENMLRFGNEPRLILKELKQLSCPEQGEWNLRIDSQKMPPLESLEVELCYVSWHISFKSMQPESRIRECFDFVDGECELIIQTQQAQVQEILCIQEAKIETVLPPKAAIKEELKIVAVKPVNKNTEEVVHSIRVDLDRIDRLVNTVGEMVIKQAMILDAAQSTEFNQNELLIKGLQELNQHMRDLQEGVMAIRAQPVKTVFMRMPRIVRELASELKKDIALEMQGENTEIDKTVIEQLGDPLMHMIRNAVDHGIETPEDRIAAGKSAQGTIRLLAEHRSGRIVIEITDDGKGIQREKVLKKAIDVGIVSEDANLSGEEIDHLIFHPGFSTAASVTNISGRGVGMDVVKQNIQALGGRISIQSTEGKGSRFTLTLPLTLAVLDGMIVRTGNEIYVIPLINIIETLRPSKNQISHLVGGHDILELRNNTIPLIYLYKTFNVTNAIQSPLNGIIVVVETEGNELVGLVVDDILSQQQVVIKSLEANYDPILGISGATILGNGRVSLIVDVNALKKIEQQYLVHHSTQHHHTNHTLQEARFS